MQASPLDRHRATPAELQDRLRAEDRGRPFLILRDGDDRQRLVDLDAASERLTLGRSATADVTLGWDHRVSRIHAALERVGSAWAILDDGLSRNGTWVNGERLVGRRRLRDGDMIRVGDTALVFGSPDPGSGTVATRTAAGSPPTTDALTPAQRRVLLALCRPYRDSDVASPASNREIAQALHVSVDAVKTTLRGLFDLFGIEDLPQNRKRAALALQALRSGAVARRDL
jgi:pSer/pThr/pTyr-binding forkhead associated (FHA) protein